MTRGKVCQARIKDLSNGGPARGAVGVVAEAEHRQHQPEERVLLALRKSLLQAVSCRCERTWLRSDDDTEVVGERSRLPAGLQPGYFC